MNLTRPARAASLISLVPMIDVLLILLVFFMVTSTYLNLDMIPARQPEDTSASAPASTSGGATLLIRLGASGAPVMGGRELSLVELQSVLSERLASDPQTQVLILPSGLARTQALISVLDIAAEVGASHLRVIRLEGQP